MRLRFGKWEAEFTGYTCIIIIRVKENDFGLIVDAVDEVIDIRMEQVSDSPKMAEDPDGVNKYIAGISNLKMNGNQREQVVMLLHADKILGEAEGISISRPEKALV